MEKVTCEFRLAWTYTRGGQNGPLPAGPEGEWSDGNVFYCIVSLQHEQGDHHQEKL